MRPVPVSTQKQATTDARIITLTPGMYIARFNAAPNPGEFCLLSIAPGDPSVRIDFFASETVENNMLRTADDIIVVRCTGGEGKLILTSLPGAGATVTGARLDRIANALERPGAAAPGATTPAPAPAAVTSGTTAAPAAIAAGAPSAVPPAPSQPATTLTAAPTRAPQVLLKVTGHVELQGDVSVPPGQWLGDPASSRRLEGFSIDWPDRPDDVDLAYSCVMAGIGRSPAVLSGGYCGSRQRATPINAITVSLVGKQASAYALEMEVVFAGCPAQKITPGVECRGLTGREPLVALRVAMRRL